jgi:hypothetical protein
MISFELYRKSYLETLPDASDEEIARDYMEYIGPPQFFDELSSGAVRGAGQVLEGIGAAVRILTGDHGGHAAVELGEKLIEEYPRHPQLAGSIIENPGLLANPAWWAGGIGELAPFLVPQAGVAGGLLRAGLGARGAIGGAAAVGGVLEGAPTFNRMTEQGDAYGPAALKAGANIAGISALNLLPLSRAFGYGPNRGVLNRVMTTALGEGVTEVAEEPLGAFIEGNDPVEALYQGLNVFPVAALSGGLLGGAGAASQPNLPQPAPAADVTPLSQGVDYLNNPDQFNEQGEPLDRPITGWEANESGALQFKHDPRLISKKIDYDADNRLEQIIDDPVAYAAYPELRDVSVGALPKTVDGVTARSVPGRIEIDPTLKGKALRSAVVREMQRQIAYREGLQVPGILAELDAQSQESVNRVVMDAQQGLDLAADSPEMAILAMQARQTVAPNTAQSINDITADQGDVHLELTPRQAEMLVRSRPVGSTQAPATQVRATEVPRETQTETEVEQGPTPGAQPESPVGEARPPSPGGGPPNVPPSGGLPTGGDRPSSGNQPPGGGAPVELPEFIGNIRTKNLLKGADEIEVAEESHRLFEEEYAQRTRGVQTWDETLELANKEFAREMDLDWESFRNAPIGTIYNSEQQAALRAANRVMVNRVRRIAQAFNADPSSVKLEEFKEALVKQRQLWGTLAGTTAEAGRLLQQQRIKIPEAEVFAKITEGLDPEEVMEVLLSAENTGEFNAAMKRIEKAKVSDVLLEIWLSSLLTGPTTHVVNAFSNTLTANLYKAEVLLAVGIGKLTGNNAVSFREAVAYVTPHLRDVVEGARAATLAYATESDVFQASKLDQLRFHALSSQRLQTKKHGALIDKVGRGIRVPFRLLLGSDAYFKTRAYRRRLSQLAMRKALKENAELQGEALESAIKRELDSPSDKMINDAIAHANYLTFTNPTGIIAGSIKRIASKHPVLKVVFPFVQTPANILKFAFSRSPLALLSKSERSVLTGKQGKEAQDMAISRMVMGSSIMGLAGYLAAEGLITGGAPSDPRERALWYARGMQPYSVRVGDNWLAYARMEPTAILFGMTADMISLLDAVEGDPELDNWFKGVVGGMTRNLLSKTYLKGLSDLILAVTDPERYGDRYAQSFTGTLVPTGIAQIQRAQDPYLRYTTSIYERIMSRLPWQAGQLPRRVDIFGRDIRLSPEGVPSAINLFNPIYIRQYANDPVAKELLRMEVLVSPVRKKIGDYELTSVELMEYQRTTGQLLHKQMMQVISSPIYQAMSDVAKQDRLEQVRRESMKLGREIFLARNPKVMMASGELLFAERAGFEARDLLVP